MDRLNEISAQVNVLLKEAEEVSDKTGKVFHWHFDDNWVEYRPRSNIMLKSNILQAINDGTFLTKYNVSEREEALQKLQSGEDDYNYGSSGWYSSQSC